MHEFIINLSDSLNAIDDVIWGIPMLILLFGVGIFLTLLLRAIQVHKLPRALKLAFSKQQGKGDVSSFAALCTALAATIGTGNIVGVATAVSIGGPGALFWMFVAAFFGMATKYAECMLAVHYREVTPRGKFIGGPMYYIKNGIGPNFPKIAKILAAAFAIFGIMAGCLGIGTYTQINAVVDAAAQLNCNRIVASVIVTVLVGAITIGGLKFIAKTAKSVVPFMACVYVICCLCVIFGNISKVPEAIMFIVNSAFTTTSAVGGFAGATMLMAIQKGVARGIFSNEAGLGSAPLAAASAKTNSCVEQGLVNMTGTFLDTMVICMMTGLTLVMTGAWCSDQTGVQMTTLAFTEALGDPVGIYVVNISLIMFAFTTILGWNFYAERCVVYLFGIKGIMPYRIIYIAIVASYILLVLYVDMENITQRTAVETVWTVADIANGLMALPNLIALFMLRKVIWQETRDYFVKKKKERMEKKAEAKAA